MILSLWPAGSPASRAPVKAFIELDVRLSDKKADIEVGTPLELTWPLH